MGDVNQGIACRWTEAGGFTILGDLPGGTTRSFGYDVSGDGSVVVGTSWTSLDREAFIWDAAHGMRNLKSVLTTQYHLNLSRLAAGRGQGYFCGRQHHCRLGH